MLQTIDYAIMIVYIIVLVLVGLSAFRAKQENAEDYLVAGRSLNLPMLVAVVATVAIGGGVTMGTSELSYQYGFSALWRGGAVALSIFLLASLLSTKLSKMRLFTTNEVIGVFYGKYARLLGAIVSFVYLALMCVLQIVSVGNVVSAVTSMSYELSLIVATVIIMAYLILGGMLAATRTDTFQFVIMTVGIIFLATFFSMKGVGGPGNLAQMVPAEYFKPMNMGGSRILANVLAFLPGFMIGQDIWQRCFTAKNARVQKTGIRLAGIYILIYSICAVLLGVALYAVNQDVAITSQVFSLAVVTFLPAGLRGLVLIALMAAIVSSANGAVLGAAATLYTDIITPFTKKEFSGKQQIMTLRIISAVVIVASALLALFMRSIVAVMDVAYAYLTGCLFIPMVFGILLKRCSARSGLFSILISFVAVTAFLVKDGITANSPIIAGMIVSAVVFFGVRFFDKDKKEIVLESAETKSE